MIRYTPKVRQLMIDMLANTPTRPGERGAWTQLHYLCSKEHMGPWQFVYHFCLTYLGEPDVVTDCSSDKEQAMLQFLESFPATDPDEE